jgi:hypothetical protein
MFRESDEDWGDDIGVSNAVLLDVRTELVRLKLGHDDDGNSNQETVMQTQNATLCTR